MNIFRIRKNLSLHIVNLVGLAVMMAAVLVSVNYIKREYSYDRCNTNADRIARLSLQFGSEQVDGRIWGNEIDGVINQLPDVERMVKMYRVYSASLAYLDNHIAVNDIYLVSWDFMQVFDICR